VRCREGTACRLSSLSLPLSLPLLLVSSAQVVVVVLIGAVAAVLATVGRTSAALGATDADADMKHGSKEGTTGLSSSSESHKSISSIGMLPKARR